MAKWTVAIVRASTDAAAEVALEHGGYERPDWLEIGGATPLAAGCIGETCTAIEAIEPSSKKAHGALDRRESAKLTALTTTTNANDIAVKMSAAAAA